MLYKFSVPSPKGEKLFRINSGESMIFVGANGSGKTRLAVYLEGQLDSRAHRISAHRALNLNTKISKISEKEALDKLRYGLVSERRTLTHAHRKTNRWGNKASTFLLNDYDYLLQALFANQGNITQEFYNKFCESHESLSENFEETRFLKLSKIWEAVFPNLKLVITGDDIEVHSKCLNIDYDAGEMSDGERAAFYIIGQTLMADDGTLLIIDEPELHLHKNILSKLCDELEAARSDCAFLYITHDLDFAAHRTAQKYVIQSFAPAALWFIRDVPKDAGIDEETTTKILGSRQPVLFVEGAGQSLDAAIYRCCYREMTVVPRGSCAEVIRSVQAMRKNIDLTRLACTGIMDADGHDDEDRSRLAALGITVLPVAEVENLILMPEVSRAIASHEGYADGDLDAVVARLNDEVFDLASRPEERGRVVARYCKRRVDSALKRIVIDQSEIVSELEANFQKNLKSIDIQRIASEFDGKIGDAIMERDIQKLLELYDHKGFLALSAKILRNSDKSSFESWLVRALRSGSAPLVADAIASKLPGVNPTSTPAI